MQTMIGGGVLKVTVALTPMFQQYCPVVPATILNPVGGDDVTAHGTAEISPEETPPWNSTVIPRSTPVPPPRSMGGQDPTPQVGTAAEEQFGIGVGPGHIGPPPQAAAVSQMLVAAAQVVPTTTKPSEGHVVEAPSQVSATSHTPAIVRQTVPDLRGPQVPSLVAPAATEQAWQSFGSPPPHALAQQTRSTQSPEAHSVPVVHAILPRPKTETGTSDIQGLPFPSWPSPSWPQHTSFPVRRTAQVLYPPAATDTASVSPETTTGTAESVEPPSPSWP
jgi:hypothetical protein